VVAALEFLTPIGGLAALAVVLPIVAASIVAIRSRILRSRLSLAPPVGSSVLEPASFLAILLLLGLAATGPALRRPIGHGFRKQTQAIFVVDVSRSMGASSSRGQPTRLDQARAAALRLRASIPDVAAGISSLTTQLLPELFPTTDESAFRLVLARVIGVLRPPPPAFQYIATTYDPLGNLRDQGFFASDTTARVAILLTDGESTTFYPDEVGQRLRSTAPPQLGIPSPFPQKVQSPVKLIVLRFGTMQDRLYLPGGKIDAGYRPDLGAASTVTELARDAGGSAFDGNQVGPAIAVLHRDLGAGATGSLASSLQTTALAPYVALAALVPLGFLLWQRNVSSL
jgi:von Willebrand factor type A domain